jgi:hypothetical protein
MCGLLRLTLRGDMLALHVPPMSFGPLLIPFDEACADFLDGVSPGSLRSFCDGQRHLGVVGYLSRLNAEAIRLQSSR